MKKLNAEEFIKKANFIHNNKFCYSRVNYNKWDEKVEIICKLHGSFFQTPNHHLSGKQCLFCSREMNPILYKKKSNEQFIIDAENIHGKRYSYVRTNYISAHEKIEIICYIHGIFLKSPTHHLSGQGCPKCKKSFIDVSFKINKRTKKIITQKSIKSKSKSLEQFITEAIKVHGKDYDYTDSVYSGTHKPITIKCNYHGEFTVTPRNHLKGAKCKKCFEESRRKTRKHFLEEARINHKNKYDYSKFDYVDRKTKSIIVCHIHGEFKQSPNQHMYYGCTRCNSRGNYCESWFYNDDRKNKIGKLYLIKFTNDTEVFYKIGMTITKRFGNKYRNYTVEPVLEIYGKLFDVFKLEKFVLDNFVSKYQYIPLNFCDNKNGKTECFVVNDETLITIIEKIKELNNDEHQK